MNAASRRFPRQWFAIATLICLLLIGAVTVSAQGTPTPIIIGENQTAEVTDTNGSVQYSLSVAAPQSVNVQVLAISSGFVPTFHILDPSGIVILDAANPNTQTIAQGTPNLSSPGTYLIGVGSANSAPGQFLISVQPGEPLAPPQALVLGQPLEGTVDANETRAVYSFTASANDVLLLTVRTDDPASGVVVALRNTDSGDTLGLSNAQLGGVRYRILIGQIDYLLEVMHPGGEPKTFIVCLETESGSVTCPAEGAAVIPPAQTAEVSLESSLQPSPTLFLTPTIDPNGACTVRSASGVSINVRVGPGTGFSVIGQLAPNTSAPVIGRLADNSWFQVNVSSVIGWVSASVVTLGGNCAGVAVVVPPPAPPTAPPTQTAVPTQSSTPNNPTITLTPSSTPSATPTVSGTLDPIFNVTAIFTVDEPDLTAQPWGTPIINGVVYLDVRVVNLGTASPAAPFMVTACISNVVDASGFPGDHCQYQSVDLGSASGKVVTFGVPPGVQGEHLVSTMADSSSLIGESNENNNSSTEMMDFH